MAYTKKDAVKDNDKKETKITKENEIKTEVITEKNEIKEKKKFQEKDMIPCISITPGEMFYLGSKSKLLYTFANIDDVVEIEFRDLDYAARSKDAMMFKPRFIVQDGDFVALHPALDNIYSSLHTTKDLKDILRMSPKQMEKTINSLPEGAKESIKTIAVTMIDNGILDSIQRIKVLDSIFGTDMLLKLTSVE